MEDFNFSSISWTGGLIFLASICFALEGVWNWKHSSLIKGKIKGFKFHHHPGKKYLYGSSYSIVPLVEYSMPGQRSIVKELHGTNLVKPENTKVEFHVVDKGLNLIGFEYARFWGSLLYLAYSLTLYFSLIRSQEYAAFGVMFLIFFYPIMVLLPSYVHLRYYGLQNKWLIRFSERKTRNYLFKGSGWEEGQILTYNEIEAVSQKNKYKWLLDKYLNAFCIFLYVAAAFVWVGFGLYYYDELLGRY